MKDQYVDIPPELMGKADPDQQWIERELNRINPWRHEQGADVATDRALRQLVMELRTQLQAAPIANTGGPAFPAFEVRTHDTGDLVENAMGCEMLIREVCDPSSDSYALKPVMKAAPDMLGVLKAFSDYVRDEQMATDGAVTYSTTAINHWAFLANAAISKAGGAA